MVHLLRLFVESLGTRFVYFQVEIAILAATSHSETFSTMPTGDPRFQSIHLEATPSRRDQYRSARERLRDGCGAYTLHGDTPAIVEGSSAIGSASSSGGETASLIIPSGTFWVQNGEILFPLEVGVNSVGRLPDNTVVLRDDCVSRRHCAIVIHRNGMCEIHDVASKNGTLVNGHKIGGPTRLKPGDRITLCNCQLLFLKRDEQPK